MNLLRLRGRKVCDHLLRKGLVWKGKTMQIRWLPLAPRHPSVDPEAHAIYVGTITSAHLDKSAVRRNRMRRRCKEALRTLLKNEKITFSGSLQLLMSPRSSSLTAPFPAIQSDLRAFLSSHARAKTQ